MVPPNQTPECWHCPFGYAETLHLICEKFVSLHFSFLTLYWGNSVLKSQNPLGQMMFYLKIPGYVATNTAGISPDLSSKISSFGAAETAKKYFCHITLIIFCWFSTQILAFFWWNNGYFNHFRPLRISFVELITALVQKDWDLLPFFTQTTTAWLFWCM